MSALLVFSVVFIIAIIVRFYEKSTNRHCESLKKLEGKLAIVTGGTTGMGLEIAKDLAKRGAKVIIACPFEEEGVEARKTIVEETGNLKVIFKLLDLSSTKSVRNFASDVILNEERLDILINNAGVGVPRDKITKDGMSFIMQINYFGHFLLTLLLLPLLKKTGTKDEPSRIVNTSSILHMIGAYDIKHLNRIDHFMVQIYAKSKICLILFARELTKKLKETNSNVVINSIDPGAVGTRIFDSAGKSFGFILTYFFGSFFKTPKEGCQTALHVALDNQAGKVSGEFFKNCEQAKAVRWAYNERLEQYVWKQSVKCVNLSQEELDMCFKSL